MSLETATMAGRAAAEALMVDACTITAGGGDPVWNEDRGDYDIPGGTTLYSGKCRVQIPNAAEQNADAGERDWTVQAAIISLPVTGTEDVKPGHTVAITAAVLDVALVGRRYTVRADHAKSNATARRLRCEEVTS